MTGRKAVLACHALVHLTPTGALTIEPALGIAMTLEILLYKTVVPLVTVIPQQNHHSKSHRRKAIPQGNHP